MLDAQYSLLFVFCFEFGVYYAVFALSFNLTFGRRFFIYL